MIKAAVLWIVNEEGEILLAQRAHHKAQDPGVWGTAAAGKLEAGESFDDAVVRETEFEKDFAHPDGEPRKFGIYYAVLPKSKSALIHVDANEVAGFAWYTLEAIEDKMQFSAGELVPSANALWPSIFQALKEADVL
jgi:isopentenyldiphosphate isomerase